MIVRTRTEIAKLDEELNLFDECDWNFFEVLETHETNFEYFDDSQDLDFSVGSKILREVKIILISVLSLIFIVVGGFTAVLYRNSIDTYRLDDSIINNKETFYVEGLEADSIALINASNTLSRYFRILELQKDFSSLDDYCLTKSDFASTYYKYKSKIDVNYDSYDCYSRALKLLTESIEYESIERVIIKNNTYYVYAKMNVPTSASIEEYWYSLQFNISKRFSSGDLTETELEKYLVEIIDPDNIPVTKEVWCFEMKEDSDGSFKIVSDSQVTDLCKDSYSYLLSKAIQFLGSSLIN